MTSMSNISMTLAELSQLLDVYGADRTRWPAEMRAAAAVLTARDAGAGRLLAEAEALDRVLERAPVPPLASEAALAERIVAAAQRSPRIVKLPGGQSAAAPAAGPAQAAALPAVVGDGRRRPRLLSREAGAVGVLAASLAFGVVIGSSGVVSQILPALADVAGSSSDNLALVQIALSADEDMQ
jgi:hypothetical protein